MNDPDPEATEPDRASEDAVAGAAEGTDPNDAAGAVPEREPPSDQTSDQPRNNSPRRAALLTVMVLGLGVVALNCPYRYTVAMSQGLGGMTTPVDFSPLADDPPRLGGWPFRFVVSYDATETQAAYRVIALCALLYNVGLAIIPIALAAIYVYRRSRRIAAGKLSGKRITIADLLAITLLLAVPLGLWQRLTAVSKSEQEFAKQIQMQGGGVQLQAWAPAFLVSRLPEALISKLQQIRAVRLESATDQLLAQVVQQPGLMTLRIGGADYDLRLLDRLVSNPFIHDLRVAGRVIDTTTLQAIAAHPRLHTLNLMRTNVSAESLTLLNDLSGLQRLSLIHADIELSELKTPKWSSTIRELRLPHPEPGQSDSLAISGWPKLASLEINELDTQANSTVMKVTLADLPELENLGLDIFQKFDLTLRNLPKLKEITQLNYEWRSRIPREGTAPGRIWFAGLDIEGLPLMGDIELFAVDLEKLRVVGAPQIKTLGIAAFYLTYSQQPYARELTPQAAAALIDGLGNSDGPWRVDLDAVPLKGVDLSPLKNNRGLQQLMLSQSQTTLEQWQGLEGMTWLTRLDIKGCPIDDAGIKWVLDNFPELEHFAFSPSADSFYSGGKPLALEIIDQAKLKVLDFGEMPTQIFRKVRIINSPGIGIELKLGYVSELEIRGSPGIKGLAVDWELPENAKLQDLRDLTFFAVGGAAVTDETIAAIADCRGLATITLAYPSVTAAGLKQLPNIGSVSSLNLPGAAVDDGVVEAWPAFSYLTTLDLSDTKVTGASLNKLLASGQGRRIRLDRTPIAQDQLAVLAEQFNIEQLSLAGVGIDAPTLQAVLDHGTLRELDLSDAKLDPKIFDVLLAASANLQYLVLRNCEVDSEKLVALARNRTGLVFDLSGSDASTRVQSGLLSSGRMVDVAEWQQHKMMQQMMSAPMQGYSMQMEAPPLPAMIDLENFRPQANPNLGGPAPAPVQSGFGQWLLDAFSAPGNPAAVPDPSEEPPAGQDRSNASPDNDSNSDGSNPDGEAPAETSDNEAEQ